MIGTKKGLTRVQTTTEDVGSNTLIAGEDPMTPVSRGRFTPRTPRTRVKPARLGESLVLRKAYSQTPALNCR